MQRDKLPIDALPAGAARPAMAKPPLYGLPSTAATALRAALQAQLRTHEQDGFPTPGVRRALRLVCQEAHRRGVQVEEVIIVIKDAWHGIPEVEALPPGRTRLDLLGRVVSAAIEEFYEK